MKIKVITIVAAILVNTALWADSTTAVKPAAQQAAPEASPATDERSFPWAIVLAGGAIVISLVALSMLKKKRD